MPFCMPITCNRQVDSLDRRQQNLTEVPHDIERYRALEELLLTTNQIKTIPKSIFRLHKLRFLDLSENDISSIPSDISHLTNLVELRLRNNELSDVPDQLVHCKSLEVFDLSSNNITRLPEAISQCTSLVYLGLNDVGLTQLPQDIGNLSNLRSLEVRENLVKAIPESITKLGKLQMLDLGENEFSVLPGSLGEMKSLKELYIDQNDVEALPNQIVYLSLLEQLDASANKVNFLPDDFGNLSKLTDVNLSDNYLQILPSSFGRLRNLTHLKLEKNSLTSLTDAIGNCESLVELYLSENLLSELPPSIGKLRKLSLLFVDKNNLTSIPSEIGFCSSLTILSLRENKLTEVPIEIGKCSELAILNLANNKLNHLPFTINVLFKLNALWLSETQSQSMIKLQVARDPRTGNKVLTCYLLPQQGVTDMLTVGPSGNSNFLDGPKVHFQDQDVTVDDERTLGNFNRQDTPKPKSHKEKLKKNSIDGHVIPHGEQHVQGATLALSRKEAPDTSPQGPVPTPRSALKFQSVPPTQYDEHRTSQSNLMAAAAAATSTSASANTTRELEKGVNFASDVAESSAVTRLKRINTPHYKGVRGAMQSSSAADKDRSPMPKSTIEVTHIQRIVIPKSSTGIGLSIAGGLDGQPYVEGDQGIYVSKVVAGGSADLAGVLVGDKILRVNATDVNKVNHEVAVRAMRENPTSVELTVFRNNDANTSICSGTRLASPEHTLDMSFMSDAANMSLNRETLTVSLKRDHNGVGFAVAGGPGNGRDNFFISEITPGGVADRQKKLMVGDRILAINGTKVAGILHDQVVSLLTTGDDIYLVIQRDPNNTTTPLPSTPIITSGPPSNNTSIQSPAPTSTNPKVSQSVSVNQLGDTSSWDGRSEQVELRRDGKSLGLSVIGGVDHSCHPFGTEKSGVFISKIAAGSPADRCHRLRIADRILSVNSTNVEQAKHREAVEALQTAGPVVRLGVTHDPQPSGLREIVLHRQGNSQLGFFIHGGVDGNKANPHDDTDEGIFVDRVESNSTADRAGLRVGHRLIEVNGDSLLGAGRKEAATMLKDAPELRLLICDGYNEPCSTTKAVSTPSIYSSGVDENGPLSPPQIVSPIPTSRLSPPSTNGIGSMDSSSESAISSQAASSPSPRSPVPPMVAPKPSKIPSKIPPPVAPKPTLRLSQSQNVPVSATPESLSFSNKLKKFEHEIDVKRVEPKPNVFSQPPPEKKSLLSTEDVKKLKEAEERTIYNNHVASPEREDVTFEEQLSEEKIAPRAPSRIISKKAENRAIAAGLIQVHEPLNEVERRAMEQQKKAEWREARQKSLIRNAAESDMLMETLMKDPTFATIAEEKILENETSARRTESIDPITGTRSVTVEENSITTRQIDLNLPITELSFADD